MKTKKMEKRKKENIDILGTKWRLAPGGRDEIDRCQTRLMDVQYETQGLSALFRNMGNCEMDAGDLYGIGITLDRISRRLAKTLDKLSHVTAKEDEPTDVRI